ncbi:hypothetical protein PR048_023986 [Dryococelus australis]|uniref:Uncharacterized protein n=1 Tax=Dryococelus australis TaxID=614101 RepID=A0ABQ9GVM7_9NEOP|nr:hypothetical protein PR048_023986 [Dryococelus australis]
MTKIYHSRPHFTRDDITKVHNQHVQTDENPLAVLPYHHQVPLNMCARVFPNKLTGQVCTNFLENILPVVLGHTSLIIIRRAHFVGNGDPAHVSHMARRYLELKFPDRWIIRLGLTAWPPRSPD